MKSRWSDSDLQAVVQRAKEKNQNLDLATSVYSTRLLGLDPEMVLHGGGNTSGKTTMETMDETKIDAICFKGGGWDMDTIEGPGLPALNMESLCDLTKLDAMTDVEMVRELRRLPSDPTSPNPSVEVILHALIPAKHVDHTHSNAIVSIANQPDGEALPRPIAAKLYELAAAVKQAVEDHIANYSAHFERTSDRAGSGLKMLDPAPRAFYIPGVGIFAAGKSLKVANVGADVIEATIDVIFQPEGFGTFEPISEEDLFDIEYWSLEQIKLATVTEQPLSRQIAIVTGAASGLGLGVTKALKAQGAEVAMMDIAANRLADAATDVGGFPVTCDVTNEGDVAKAVAKVVEQFGGVDILISNAGAAFSGALLYSKADEFQNAFDLSFWSHHVMAREVVKVMKVQETGGALVSNISKQSVDPGSEIGPYGTSEAAHMVPMKQYAVEHEAVGITPNDLNADRIRTGLLTDDIVVERSKARDVNPEESIRGNLMKREVFAEDDARAFVHLAKGRTTIGSVLSVDGGNAAAMLR